MENRVEQLKAMAGGHNINYGRT